MNPTSVSVFQHLSLSLSVSACSFQSRLAKYILMMGSCQIRFPPMGFEKKAESRLRFLHISHGLHCSLMVGSGSGFPPKGRIWCGLRAGPKKPLWRSRVLSTEAIHAVQSLKLAKSDSKLEEIFESRLSRLLKKDLIDTLAELQRQNEWELALKVFEFVRKELWYKPDLSMYCDLIFMSGKHKMIETAEKLFFELKKEGLEPNTRTYTEMIGAFLQVGMMEKAMDAYRSMKESGCAPDKLTLTILIRNLEKAGEEDLASTVKKDCEEYLDYPEKFLEEVGRKYPKRSLELV